MWKKNNFHCHLKGLLHCNVLLPKTGMWNKTGQAKRIHRIEVSSRPAQKDESAKLNIKESKGK